MEGKAALDPEKQGRGGVPWGTSPEPGVCGLHALTGLAHVHNVHTSHSSQEDEHSLGHPSGTARELTGPTQMNESFLISSVPRAGNLNFCSIPT